MTLKVYSSVGKLLAILTDTTKEEIKHYKKRTSSRGYKYKIEGKY